MGSMLLTFFLVSATLIVISGPNALIVLRNGLTSRGAAVASAAGTGAGALTWGAAAAVGLAAILQRSSALYETIKLVGAAYLIFLGVQAFRSHPAATDKITAVSSSQVADGFVSSRSAFMAGYVSDVFNPKTGLFYVAIVPQVIPHGLSVFGGTLAFCAIDACVTTCWFTIVACLAQRFSGWLRRPRVLVAAERSTGAVLVGLGLRTAVERS